MWTIPCDAGCRPHEFQLSALREASCPPHGLRGGLAGLAGGQPGLCESRGNWVKGGGEVFMPFVALLGAEGIHGDIGHNLILQLWDVGR